MSERITATDRLRRLLALVPWVAAHPEGVAIEEICERFEVTRARLLSDLDVIMMVGVHPFTPDALIDVWIADDVVRIRFAEYFSRPLRLTPGEGLALVAAGNAVLGAPGSREVRDGPMASALDKLSAVIGAHGSATVDIDLGAASDEVYRVLDDARRDGHQVEIDYYSFDRDERSVRRIEPATLWTADGHWYVAGWCHQAQAERVFRLDRIAGAQSTIDDFVSDASADESALHFDGDLPEAELEIDPGSLWLFDSVPNFQARTLQNGRVSITVSVASTVWLERVLLQLGERAKVVRLDDRLGSGDIAAQAAERVLRRYLEV